MSFPHRILLGAFVAFTFALEVRSDESRRFFDFTPVSPGNPVVATIDGAIEIPLSELRGFRDAEKLRAITDSANLDQKRAVLEALLDQYLLVDRAYRDGVVESPAFMRQMDSTRTMILTDFMAMRAAAAASTGASIPSEPGNALAEKLFEAATIEISNEAYELVKRAAREIEATGDSPQSPSARVGSIVAGMPDAVLVRYDDRLIRVRPVIALYASMPRDKRPAVQTEPGLVQLVKPLILPELMAAEARRQGVSADPAFRQKLTQNQNALLRFHVHGLIERRANELMQAPDIEDRLREWYNAHRLSYSVYENGLPRPATFAEARARVEGDYSVAVRDRLMAEEVAALRRVRSIQVDDAALAAL